MFNSFALLSDYYSDEAAMFGLFAVIYLLVMFMVLMISLAMYILGAFGLYTLAKRRQLQNPWLAWIPIGNTLLLGRISDQYQYIVKNKRTNRGKILFGLNIAICILAVLLFALYFVFVMMGISYGFGGAHGSLAVLLVLLIAVYLIMLGVTITSTVLSYIAYYDVFSSCSRDNAVAYLIVSIFISGAAPIIVFAIRNKDDGMIPYQNPSAVPPQM